MDENDTVKTGDVLVTLDTTRLKPSGPAPRRSCWPPKPAWRRSAPPLTETRLIENRQKALRQKGLSTGQDMDTAEAHQAR